MKLDGVGASAQTIQWLCNAHETRIALMRLRQIEIFYHVYKAGSISGAARELNVSQPSVSKVLRHAEDQIGVDLFCRRKGKLIPTQAAHELFSEAEDLYSRLSLFNEALENLGKRRGGHIRLAVLPSLSLSVAPEMLSDLRLSDPSMSFELTTLHTADILQALLSRQSDICIGFDPLNDDRIAGRRIGTGRMVLVSGRSIETSSGTSVKRFIQGADFIGIRDSGPLGNVVDQCFTEQGISPNEIATVHTYHVALSLVRKKVGVAITDEFTAYSQLGAGLHRYILQDFPDFPIYASTLAAHPEEHMIARGIGIAETALARLKSGIEQLQPAGP